MSRIQDISEVNPSLLQPSTSVHIELAPPLIKPPTFALLGEKLAGLNSSFTQEFLRTLEKGEEINQKRMQQNLAYFNQQTAEVEEISAATTERIKENAQAQAKSSFWSWLAKIAKLIFYAISSLLGIGLVATGVGIPLGCSMIAAGVFGVTNEVLESIGGWTWIAKQMTDDVEKQKKIATALPIAFTVLFIAASTASGAIALAYTQQAFAHTAGLIFSGLQAILEGSLKIGKASVDFNIKTKANALEAEKDKTYNLEKHIEFIQQKLTDVGRSLTKSTTQALAIIRSNMAQRKLFDLQ